MPRAVRWLPVLLLAAAMLAGCAEEGPPPTPDQAAKHTVHGLVMTAAFNPVAGAQLTLEQPGVVLVDGTASDDVTRLEARTDASGRFTFTGVWPGDHTVAVSADGMRSTSARITAPGDNVTITMVPEVGTVPYQESWPFSGYIECGADHVIFAGSCDDFAGAVVDPLQGTFPDEREFFFDVADGWRSAVIDISFDELPPTLDRLRLAAYAPDNDAEVLTYERYAFESGSEPFTLRIDAGVDYGQALPTPENATTIRLEVFPQGYGYHQVCDPTGAYGCFTGAGVSARIEFEVVATVFYHEAAPEGWTLLA